MGRVKIETAAQGRGSHDWDYAPLSDERVVAEMIRNRMKLDGPYASQLYAWGGCSASGAYTFREGVTCAYIDQDAQIQRAALTKSEREVVGRLMAGWSAQDIADWQGLAYTTIDTWFRRAVAKIVQANDRRWREHYEVRKAP